MAIEQEWRCGKTNPSDFIVTLKGDTLIYSGNGEKKGRMVDENTPWHHYRNNVTTMVLQNSDEDLNMSIPFDCYKNLRVINISHNVKCDFLMGEFDENYNLTEINVDRNNMRYSSIDGVLYDKYQSTLIYCPQKTKAKEINIPSTVRKIDAAAFRNCRELFSVTIPNVEEIGFGAFEGCTNLKFVKLPDGIKEIGSEVFGNCPNLKTVTIGTEIIDISTFVQMYH